MYIIFMSYRLFVQIRWMDYGLHPPAPPGGRIVCVLLLALDFCPPNAASNSCEATGTSAPTQYEHHLPRLHRCIQTSYRSGDKSVARETGDLAKLEINFQ